MPANELGLFRVKDEQSHHLRWLAGRWASHKESHLTDRIDIVLSRSGSRFGDDKRGLSEALFDGGKRITEPDAEVRTNHGRVERAQSINLPVTHVYLQCGIFRAGLEEGQHRPSVYPRA